MNHALKTDNTPRVYVGTYAKYNNGSLKGDWLDLGDYADKETFLVACRELHSDESGPELMFQAHESIPEGYISESHIAETFWTEYLALDDDERTLLQLYRDNINSDVEIDRVRESYHGTFDSLADYAENFWTECEGFKPSPSESWWHPTNFVDWEEMGRQAQMSADISVIEHRGSLYIFNS
jgi:antirestriction protein